MRPSTGETLCTNTEKVGRYTDFFGMNFDTIRECASGHIIKVFKNAYPITHELRHHRNQPKAMIALEILSHRLDEKHQLSSDLSNVLGALSLYFLLKRPSIHAIGFKLDQIKKIDQKLKERGTSYLKERFTSFLIQLFGDKIENFIKAKEKK